jgi:hypothetical protein
MLAALRVLGSFSDGRSAAAVDIDTLRANALPSEQDCALDELACCIVYRLLESPHPLPAWPGSHVQKS